MPAKFSKTDTTATKAKTIAAIAEATELSKSDVALVLDALTELVLHDLKRRVPNEKSKAQIPGLVKISIQPTAARKARTQMIGDREVNIPARGKRTRGKVSVQALKTLKDVL